MAMDLLSRLEERLGLAPEDEAAARPEVLVVDDDPLYLDSLVQTLGRRYKLTACASGEDALARLGPGLAAAVVDIKMRGMGGLELAAELRRRRPLLPVVFNTGFPGEFLETRIERDYSPFGYVTKDNPAMLLACLKSAVRHHELTRDHQALIAELEDKVAARTAELSRLAEKLRENSAYIRTFASHVSHEFKSSLTSFRGALELLEEHGEAMTPQERARFLANLREDSGRLEALVRRLMELIRADLYQPGGESCDPSPPLAELARRMAAEGLDLELDEAEGLGRVGVGADVLETVVGNLLANARQHGGPCVRVRLAARPLPGGGARLVVADNGPGVSPGNAQRLFEPFFTTARDHGGTGLGLAIVRSLLAAHGGGIALEPAEAGAHFVVTLPPPPAAG